jgi:hypothetical protein
MDDSDDGAGPGEPGGAGDDGPPATPAFPPGAATGPAIREHWEDMVAEMEAIAAEYRENGWSVLELHPGDVTVVTESRRGLDVLLPDDEFERFADWAAEGAFDEHEVYRAEAGIVFLLVVLRDEATDRAVCCPAYYAFDEVETLRGIVEADGRLATHVRNLAEEYVTVTHEEPAEFFPETED